jgi:CRP-like cAMP-binding protein
MEPSTDTLQHLLAHLAGILPADASPLLNLIRTVSLDAHDNYIREGETSRKVAFIEQGIIRAYAITDSGDESTLFVRWEGQVIASHDCIIHGKPSRFIYQALEPATLLEINYDVLEKTLKIHPEYEPLRTFFLMRMLDDALKSIESFVTLSPEERYLNLIAERIDLVNRVPDKYIASMLGITPVSLSRIRKRINTRSRS